MRISIGVLLLGGLLLSSCGTWRGSGLNPKNWFGRSKEARIETPAEVVNPLIPTEDKARINLLGTNKDEVDLSVPIARLIDMRIERTATGAILLVSGEATRNGAYGAELVPMEDIAAGELGFVFRVTYPVEATTVGTEATRRIRAAATLSNDDLRDIRVLRVVSAQNEMTSRR